MDEQRRVSAGLGCATLVAVFFLAMIAYGLAYQTKPGYFIQVGSRLDRPFLVESSFFTREPPESARKPGDLDYRYTKSLSLIDLPGIGSQPLTVTMRIFSSENPNPQLKIYVGDKQISPELTQPPPPREWKEIVFPVLADYFKDGNLHMRLESSIWDPKGDSRKLGLLLDWVKIEPNQPAFLNPGVRPPDDTFIPLIILTVLGVLTLLATGLPTLFALLGGAGMVGGLTFWLITDRLSLTTFMPLDVLRFALFTLVLVWLLAHYAPLLYRGLGVIVSSRESGWLALFFLLSFVLLFGGQLHPQFTSSDIGLNVNNLQARVMRGSLIFSPELPNGQPAPYPPAYYIGLLPFTALLDSRRESFELLFKFAGSLLQASGVYMIYYLSSLIRSASNQLGNKESPINEKLEQEFEVGTNWVGIVAAGFYAINKYPYLIFSQGNHTNLFGEWMFLVLLCAICGALYYFRIQHFPISRRKPHNLEDTSELPALNRVLKHWGDRLRLQLARFSPYLIRAGVYIVPPLALTITYLSHYGTFLFTNVFMLCLIVLLALFGGRVGRRNALYLAGVFMVSLLLALLLYYYNYFNLIGNFFGGMLGNTPVPNAKPRQPFEILSSLQRTYSDIRYFFGLPVILAALCGMALWLISYFARLAQQEKGLRGLNPAEALLLALGLTSVAFAIMERVQNLETRYQLYLLPLVALATGAFLGRIWRSGKAGVLLVAALFLFQLVDTVSFWLERITYYFY
ncbi:hypothetical protein [Candidatus Chlorohelix sp.]|uniref:hypothetical protein n=1 Tax=Candidatus Chlorohelix sp. TaxID=3139201 RepID=UPI003058944C